MDCHTGVIICLLLCFIPVNAYRKTICERESGQIQCRNGKELIRVTNAIYGRRDTWTCPGENSDSTRYCGYSNNAYNGVSSKCSDKPNCNLGSNNADYGGDPCAHVNKYLMVDYSCDPCPPIKNCLTTSCFNRHSVTCDGCKDNILYKLADSNTKCLRKCSYDNRWCWPGKCPDEFDTSCICASGFIKRYDSTKALCQPTQKPKIIKCFMEAVSVRNDARQSEFKGTTECKNQQDFFGNFQIHHFKTSLTYDFTVIIDNGFKNKQPDFVDSYVFGITGGDVQIVKIDIAENQKQIAKSDFKPGRIEAVFEADNMQLSTGNMAPLSDGEKLCLRFHAKGGGILVSNNLGHHSNHYYEETENDRLLCYIYDGAKPVHCLSTNKCTYDPLILSKRITNKRRISVSFSGWTDPVPKGASSDRSSGIETYEISLLEVNEKNHSTIYADSLAIVGKYPLNSSTNHLDITLPDTSHPAMYAIQLAVKDFADNSRFARRFVLYDHNSNISTRSSENIKVTTASLVDNDHIWQTNLGTICFSWKNKYYNDFYQSNNFLRPIARDDNYGIKGIYEQTRGELPVSGTTNVDGLINFKYAFQKEGTFPHDDPFSNVPDFTKQSICLAPNSSDGETYVLYLQAIDIMNNTFDDNTTVHIDSSVPDIENIWLVKGDHRQLFVHGSKDLSSMILTFDAFDSHSGIATVEWALGTVGGARDIGNGKMAPNKLKAGNSCKNESLCYCPSVGVCETLNYNVSLNSLVQKNTNTGDHNRQYFFTITVTNNANLTSVEHLDILVDDSPPETGTVFEGPVDGPDIDYTDQDFTTVHWHGFIDHESGINHYIIGVSNHCLSVNEIKNQSDNVSFVKSRNTAVTVPLEREGKHVVSVMAYNNAMEPSKVVCSDGISRDLSQPVIANVTLQNANIADSIGCSGGMAWFIQNNVNKVRLIQTTVCESRCNNTTLNPVIDAMTETIAYNKTNPDLSISEFLCSRMLDFNGRTIYLPTDTVHLKWDIMDESQIDEVMVGFGSSPFSADIISYTPSKHTTSYKKQHTGLSSGSEIYCFLKVVNKAGLETILPYGPILIDENPPNCPSSLPVTVKEDVILLKWDNGTFFDFEQKERIGSIMFQIGNKHGILTPFFEWNIYESTHCAGVSGGCIKYPIQKLQQHNTEDGLSFFFRIHAYNYAGHFCSVDSDKFLIPSMFPPGNGYVIDISTEDSTNDIDVSFLPYVYCASWDGFWHHMGIEFLIGVGLRPGTDDVIKFKSFNGTTSYCEHDASLTSGRQYFTTVIASCSGGTVNATSDGFFIFDKQNVSNTVQVYDGIGCNGDVIVDEVSKFINISTHELTFRSDKELHIGKHYTLLFPDNWNGRLVIKSNESLFKLGDKVSRSIWLSHNGTGFIPLVNKPLFAMKPKNMTAIPNTILISACETEMSFLAKGSQVGVSWHVPDEISIVPSHVNVTLVKRCQNERSHSSYCDQEIHSSVVDGSKRFHHFDAIYDLGIYYFLVQICFDQDCLYPRQSNGFVVESASSEPKIIKSTLENKLDCTEFELQWKTGNADPIFYRWGIFKDNSARNNLSDMFIYHPLKYQENHSVKTCIQLPVYMHSKLFVCIQEFVLSGLSKMGCKEVESVSQPNEFDTNIVYDVDMTLPVVLKLLPSLHSLYIGDELSTLHTNELDYAKPTVTLGAIVAGRGDVNTSWFLMTTPRVPKTCNDDSDCISTDITKGGFIKFKSPLIEDRVYYICALSTINSSKEEIQDDFKACSDGVIIDNSRPVAGKVTITNKNGYIINRKEMAVSWIGFSDSKLYSDFGYGNGIKEYQYALGTYPKGRDIIPFTNLIYSSSTILGNLNLTGGFTYFVSIKAIDYVGLSTIAVSNGVFFDDTPPVSGMVHVGGLSSHEQYFSTRNINIYWMGFHDDESGIATFQLAIGTKPYISDVIPFKNYSQGYASIEGDTRIHDGRPYYAILKTYNGAGLTTTVASKPFVLDDSPPVIGKIHQGTTNKKVNKNYQLNTTTIMCHWYAFHDPHSRISYYRVGLGTEPMKSDVFQMVNVGLQQEMTWHHHFQPGTRYYITVEACNGAKLCKKESSNGIIVDNSPPIPGLVHVGMTGKHSKYLPQKTSLQAQWIGFEDPQSDIDHFEVCIGTKANSCDIMPYSNFLLSASMTKTNLNLYSGIAMYVSVRAFNKVGLYVDVSSDSFVVDETAPIVIMKPVFNFESKDKYFKSEIQIDPSIIDLKWEFTDNESYIAKQYLTLKTHHDGHTPVEQFEISPSATSLLLQLRPKSWLASGDTYFAVITACNAAELCTSVQSSNILIDDSPPLTGGFKPPLTWKSVSSNGTTLTRISLTWYGFSDVESNVSSYILSVGTDYSGSELSEGLIYVNHTATQLDEQSIAIDLKRSLTTIGKVILSVRAVNKAGLISEAAKSTVVVISKNHDHSSGVFELERHSCDTFYCTKDCTCSVFGKVCAHIKRNDTCKDLGHVGHLDGLIDIRIGTRFSNIDVTASSACLSAVWSKRDKPTLTIKRYEWSIGIKGGIVGEKIFDVLTQNVWYDVGMNTQATHCLPRGKSLEHGSEYVFYVRAWLSENEFRVYKSQPTMIDLTGPSVRKGKYVMDSDGSCQSDLQYTKETKSLSACWHNVFRDQQSDVEEYQISLGTSPGGDDIQKTVSVGKNQTITWHGLSLVPGTKYYSTVKAINRIGLENSLSSNGILVDYQPPISGAVFNTDRHRNIQFQHSTSALKASWHGFADHHSFIRFYEVTLLSQVNNETVIVLPFTSVGIKTSVELKIPLSYGQQYRVGVKAQDAAGFESETAFSPLLLVDTTPPLAFKCLNYQHIFSIRNTSVTTTWYHNISFTKDQSYRLHLVFNNMTDNSVVEFSLGRMSTLLPISIRADGHVESDYNFVSPEDGVSMVTITFHSNNIINMILISELSISNCSSFMQSNSSALMVRQLSANKISICVNTFDPESGIKVVDIGAGTTKGGFQIRSLKPLELHNHMVMDVMVPHASPVYITAMVYNHAGLSSHYESEVLIIDHTPPDIWELELTLSYTYNEDNGTLVNINTKWRVEDRDTGVRYCLCALGTTPLSSNIQSWKVSSGRFECQTDDLDIPHGTRVYGSVKCINHIELFKTASSNPETVMYLPPDPLDSKPLFILEEPGSKVQKNSTSVLVTWNPFQYESDFLQYECRINNEQQTPVTEWENVGRRTAALVDHLRMTDGKTYFAEIKSIGERSIVSNATQAGILIESRPPQLTGQPVTVTKMGGKSAKLEWENVFRSREGLALKYKVNVGSMNGFSDILFDYKTTEQSVVVPIEEKSTEFYIVILAVMENSAGITRRETVQL